MTPRPTESGPADWIGVLYDRHAGALYRYAVMILADSAAASDAVHQVFLGIAGKPPGHIRAEERYLRRRCATVLARCAIAGTRSPPTRAVARSGGRQ
jgi:DNA-directed RNA polymerase specialized sigma24 family protein